MRLHSLISKFRNQIDQDTHVDCADNSIVFSERSEGFPPIFAEDIPHLRVKKLFSKHPGIAFMLSVAGPSINDAVDEAVQELLGELARYDQVEHRSAYREPLVRPVVIRASRSSEEFEGISRNVSLTGMGLLTQEPLPQEMNATIIVEQLDGRHIRFLSSLRWCKPYGRSWFMSGWQFINVL